MQTLGRDYPEDIESATTLLRHQGSKLNEKEQEFLENIVELDRPLTTAQGSWLDVIWAQKMEGK